MPPRLRTPSPRRSNQKSRSPVNGQSIIRSRHDDRSDRPRSSSRSSCIPVHRSASSSTAPRSRTEQHHPTWRSTDSHRSRKRSRDDSPYRSQSRLEDRRVNNHSEIRRRSRSPHNEIRSSSIQGHEKSSRRSRPDDRRGVDHSRSSRTDQEPPSKRIRQNALFGRSKESQPVNMR